MFSNGIPINLIYGYLKHFVQWEKWKRFPNLGVTVDAIQSHHEYKSTFIVSTSSVFSLPKGAGKSICGSCKTIFKLSSYDTAKYGAENLNVNKVWSEFKIDVIYKLRSTHKFFRIQTVTKNAHKQSVDLPSHEGNE